MIVRLYCQLHDRNGDPLVEEIGKKKNDEGKMVPETVDVFAHVAVVNALLAPKKEDPKNPRSSKDIALEKMVYYDLAMRILQNEPNEEVELSKDEVIAIIDRIALLYNPLIAGQLLYILNEGIKGE